MLLIKSFLHVPSHVVNEHVNLRWMANLPIHLGQVEQSSKKYEETNLRDLMRDLMRMANLLIYFGQVEQSLKKHKGANHWNLTRMVDLPSTSNRSSKGSKEM